MATDTTSIVFASSNAGKVRELDALLAPLGYSVIAQGDLGVSDAEETATTFVENALLKARHACRETGRPAIADDSGLEVDALNGAPGLSSAAWEGHVLKALDGEGGFGYDPLFCNHDTRESAARLDTATKNRLSHRGKAVAELVRLLRAEQ